MKKTIIVSESQYDRIVKMVINESSIVLTAPYIKNVFGGVGKVNQANKKDVEKVMSEYYKTPIRIFILPIIIYTII